jgi:hypothetical protein
MNIEGSALVLQGFIVPSYNGKPWDSRINVVPKRESGGLKK